MVKKTKTKEISTRDPWAKTFVVVVVLLFTTSQKEKKSFRNALRPRPVSLVSLCADEIVYRGMSAA